MNRTSNPDSAQPRRGLGGVCLLMLVAMTLSAGIAGADWAGMVGPHRDQTQGSTRHAGAVVHAAQRAERRQTIRPSVQVSFNHARVQPDFSGTTEFSTLTIESCPARLRHELLSLPPPART